MHGESRKHRAQAYSPGPFGRTYLILLLLGAVAVAIIYALLSLSQSVSLVRLPSDSPADISVRIELLKLSLASTAGVAAVAGLYVAYRKQRNEEFNAAREQDKVFTERFSSAAQLLESEKAAVRMAGLNAVARLADDSSRDRGTCLKTICAYLRLPMTVPDLNAESPDQDEDRSESMWLTMRDRSNWADPEEWEVRRSGAALLSARLDMDRAEIFWSGGEVDLRNAVLIDFDLSGCTIDGSLDASGAVFVSDRGMVWEDLTALGKVVFIGARFTAAVALQRSNFKDQAYFFGANFDGLLHLNNCAFETHLSMAGVSVKDVFEIRGGEYRGYVTFARMQCGGIFKIESSDLRMVKPVQGGSLGGAEPDSVEFLELDESSLLGGLRIVDSKLPPIVSMTSVEIAGSVVVDHPDAVDMRRVVLEKASLDDFRPRAILSDNDGDSQVVAAAFSDSGEVWSYTAPDRPREGYQIIAGD